MHNSNHATLLNPSTNKPRANPTHPRNPSFPFPARTNSFTPQLLQDLGERAEMDKTPFRFYDIVASPIINKKSRSSNINKKMIIINDDTSQGSGRKSEGGKRMWEKNFWRREEKSGAQEGS